MQHAFLEILEIMLTYKHFTFEGNLDMEQVFTEDCAGWIKVMFTLGCWSKHTGGSDTVIHLY